MSDIVLCKFRIFLFYNFRDPAIRLVCQGIYGFPLPLQIRILLPQRMIETGIQIFIKPVPQFLNAGKSPPLFQHIGKIDEDPERRHPAPPARMIADGVQDVPLLDMKEVFREIGARILMENGRGDAVRRVKSLQKRRIGRDILPAVMQRRRKQRLPLFYPAEEARATAMRATR